MASAVQQLLGRSEAHGTCHSLWRDEGLDQGDPLSPPFFGLPIRCALETLERRLREAAVATGLCPHVVVAADDGAMATGGEHSKSQRCGLAVFPLV